MQKSSQTPLDMSRKLQNSQSVCSPTNHLRCEENASNLMNEDRVMEEFASIEEEFSDDEHIQTLLDAESTSLGLQLQELLTNSWITRARLDAINYILRMRDLLRFRNQTAYASVTYLDRFLSRRSVGEEKTWAVRLLAMACLSLAAKNEETTVPGLSDFCLEDYSFECSVIQRMELLVLTTLEWKMGAISPFDFLHFFANKFCDKTQPRNGVSRIVEVIISTMRDVKIMCHRPSVIAAAAILAVLYEELARDALQLKISLLTSNGYFQSEDIVACYYRVLEMGIKSPDLSTTKLDRGEPHENSSVTSIASAKRKRLNGEENGDMPEKKGKL